MSCHNDKFVAPLKKAKGLGSAHEGADHWIKHKITAVANIPLVIWFVFSMVGLQGASHEKFTYWLSQPINAILMILLVISVLLHAKLGTQVIVEDYVACKGSRLVTLVALKLAFFAVGVACIFSVLKIAFTAGF